MYNELYDYFDNILFPSQCGFCKIYIAQHLLVMIKKFKGTIDRKNKFGMNYGVSPLSINMFFSYLVSQTKIIRILT